MRRWTEAPPLPEKVAKQVKQKQIKRLLRQARAADAAVRPSVAVLEDLMAGRKLALCGSLVSFDEDVFALWQRQRRHGPL